MFADTCGYHKQLKPESDERLLLVSHYVSGTPSSHGARASAASTRARSTDAPLRRRPRPAALAYVAPYVAALAWVIAGRAVRVADLRIALDRARLECLAHVALPRRRRSRGSASAAALLAPLGRSGDRALDVLNRARRRRVAFALLTSTLGWFGSRSTRELFVPPLAAGAVLGALELAALRPSASAAWPAWQLALLALIGLYVAHRLVVDVRADLVGGRAPATTLPHPSSSSSATASIETPWAWNSYQPYTVEMLVLDGFLLWDGVQGAFAPLLLLFAGTAATGLGAARLAGRTVGCSRRRSLLCQPFTTSVGTSTFVEPGLVLAVALGALEPRALRAHGLDARRSC